MGSPFVSADGIIPLDSILAYAVYTDITRGDLQTWQTNNAIELINMPVPCTEILTADGKRYFSASWGIFDDSTSIGRWKKRWEEDFDNLVDFGGRKCEVDHKSGGMKAYDMPLVLRSAPEIIFYANGNHDEIRRLLKSHITHIGKKRSQGWGRITGIEVDKIEHDKSCWSARLPMRSVPVDGEAHSDLKVSHVGYRPPYWLPQNQALCYVP